jgi:hypothetical protein
MDPDPAPNPKYMLKLLKYRIESFYSQKWKDDGSMWTDKRGTAEEHSFTL